MITLTTNHDTAYKFKADGKLTPFLHYLSEKGGMYVFKPVEDTESTNKVEVIHIYLAKAENLDQLNAKVYTQCKFYGSWELAPHICGQDCPLGK